MIPGRTPGVTICLKTAVTHGRTGTLALHRMVRAPAQFANIDLDVKSERLAMLEEDNYARVRQRVEAEKEEESFVQCFNGIGK